MKQTKQLIDVAIGLQIKHARITKKLSMQNMADYLGVSKSNYFYYETGDISIDITTLFKICDKLNISYIDVLEYAKKVAYNK